MYTWTHTTNWHIVKNGTRMSLNQKKQLEELGYRNAENLTYQGAECLLQEIISWNFN
jgi:hypothetical protein